MFMTDSTCTDLIPRDELNLECMTTAHTIVDYTISVNGKVTEEELQKLINPLVDSVETMASVQTNKIVDEVYGQMEDDHEESEKMERITTRRAELSELEAINNVYAHDNCYYLVSDFYGGLDNLSYKYPKHEDPFYLKIELDGADKSCEDLDDDEVMDVDDEDEYRPSNSITIDERFISIVNSSDPIACVKTILKATKSLRDTAKYLEFSLDNNLFSYLFRQSIRPIIELLYVLCESPSNDSSSNDSSSNDSSNDSYDQNPNPKKRSRSTF
jgi:hypothetical protein